MAVIVGERLDYPTEKVYTTATKWSIDKDDHLHLYNEEETEVAIYARGEWLFARIKEDR